MENMRDEILKVIARFHPSRSYEDVVCVFNVVRSFDVTLRILESAAIRGMHPVDMLLHNAQAAEHRAHQTAARRVERG